jgi:hypothetical protein
MKAAGRITGGCYVLRTADTLRIRTSREPTLHLTATRRGSLALCLLPGGGLESEWAEDEATLCRWAVRLAVEFGKSVELTINKESK